MKHPRPLLKRDNFTSLNGIWLCNGKEVNVPSCRQEEELKYEKEFIFKKENDRCILHFDGVDQICEVFLNGNKIGRHESGYLPFEFDVTEYIVEGNNKLEVNVIDRLDIDYPYGKQSKNPKGMWYTPVSGIWKNVWYEQVSNEYIKSIKITTDLNGIDVDYEVSDSDIKLHKRIDIDNPILWDVDNPHLYYDTLEYKNDKVEFYYGLRTIKILNIDGVNRVCLNNKPIILNGVLDQGYWEDTLFIPNEEDGYKKDILRMKELGFNTLRKHIKIEDEQFYYECDKLGMLIIQDMVQTGKYSFIRDTALPNVGFNFNDIRRTLNKAQNNFIKHSIETLSYLYNHPSIVVYTIFNEGWGQFNADEIYEMFRKIDPTRLYDSTSGWFKKNKSDFESLHIYFKLKEIYPKDRPLLVSECGGYVLEGNQKASWGYGKCQNEEELTSKIEELYNKMIIPKIKDGCCGCIYTQLSDVEGEINGLYTFDRKKCKVIKERLSELFKKLKV